MSLPTDLAADLTNPADEIPASAYEPEADPAFDADPLADATGIVTKDDSGSGFPSWAWGVILGGGALGGLLTGVVLYYRSRQ